jgi:hypothetical protein
MGAPVMFRWFGDVPVSRDNHLSAATESFLHVIEAPGRFYDDFAVSTLVAEFQFRILQAMRGQLSGTRKIKTIALFPAPPLFEIRWNNMTVTERNSDGSVAPTRLAVRLYHSEPKELQGCFIGHLVHEKKPDLLPSEKQAQNEMITSAANFYLTGRPTLWAPIDTTHRNI